MEQGIEAGGVCLALAAGGSPGQPQVAFLFMRTSCSLTVWPYLPRCWRKSIMKTPIVASLAGT